MLRVPVELPQIRIRCPRCESPSLTIETTKNQTLQCSACGQSVKLEGGVIDLLQTEAPKPSTRGQKLMESPWFARIYESRLARRNPLMRMWTGLSFEGESRLLRRAAKLGGAERVLDVACGTGNHSRNFAKAVPRGMVVGLDLSRPMLEMAGRWAREEEIRNLLFVHANALALPFDDDSFDVVSCGAGMHLISPLGEALGEMHRVLNPGGRIVASVPRRSEGKWLGRLAKGGGKRFGVHPFAPGELESAWEKAGFTNIAVHHAFRGWMVIGAEKSRA